MKILLMLFQLLPEVIKSVAALNTVATLPGASKKQTILHVIDVAAQIGEKIPVPLVSGISLLIDKVAATINNTPIVVVEPTTITTAPSK